MILKILYIQTNSTLFVDYFWGFIGCQRFIYYWNIHFKEQVFLLASPIVPKKYGMDCILHLSCKQVYFLYNDLI
jgi:hypothetical protein